MSPENNEYKNLLCGHMRVMVRRLRQIPEDQWDWTPHVAAPTARILAVHAWQWLICDRQHITEADAMQHPNVPEPPESITELCDAMDAEIANWDIMLLALTPEQMDEQRYQFNQEEGAMTVRGFISHMVQNCIYKHGQLSTLYFALGLDGTDPYDAPFPNTYYPLMRAGWPEDGEQ